MTNEYPCYFGCLEEAGAKEEERESIILSVFLCSKERSK